MPTQNFRVGELLNKRTRNSKTWINFDGSYTTEIYTTDVHYQDENGNWQNINTDLYDEADLDQVDFPVAKEGAEEFRIMKTAALNLKKRNILDRDSLDFQGLKVPFDCRIPRNFKRGYVIGKGKHKLRFIPVGVSPTKGFVDENQKNKITYQDPWNDVDVTLEVLPNGIKETIILKSSESPTKFTFEVDGPLEDDLTAGTLRLQPPWLQDANGEKRDVSQTIRRENGKTYVDLVADVTGLTYPVKIDPTVMVQPDGTTGIDALISEGNPTANFGASTTIEIGLDNSGKKVFSLLRFDVSQISGTVTSADLTLTFYSGGAGGNVIGETRIITSNWLENTVTWNTKPSYEATTFDPTFTIASGSNLTIDIKNTVQKWVDGVYPNYGIVLKPIDTATTVGSWRDYCSSDFGTLSMRPKLTVTYNIPPTAPTVTSPNGGETWNAQHTIAWNATTDGEEKLFINVNADGTYNTNTTWATTVYWPRQYIINPSANTVEVTKIKYRLVSYTAGTTYKLIINGTTYNLNHGTGGQQEVEFVLPTPLVVNGSGSFWVQFEDTGSIISLSSNSSSSYPGTFQRVTRNGETIETVSNYGLCLTVSYRIPSSSLQYQIQLSPDNGQTWKDIVPLTSPGATSYTYDFSNEPETSLAKIRIRAYDGTSYGPWDESDGVFTIQHNQAPTVPTNLSPSGGTPKDRGSVIRLSWQHNDANGDPQAQFDLQWRKQGDTTWNTVTQVTPNQYWDAPGGTFPRGTIEWRVRTYDQAGLSSPYSDIQTFFAGDKPANPTITDPANGAIVPVANPTVQWSSVGQTAYHVKVLDVNNNLLWEVQANSTNKAQTVLYDLQNNTDYKIQVAIKNADSLWSDFVTSNIHVSYTPPAVPIVTTTKGEGIITVSIDNPTPSGTEPNVSYNDLYRRKQGETEWIRIATNIPADGSFVDYTPTSGQIYEYYVRAWGDNGTYSDSTVVSESISLTGVWLHDPMNPAGTIHQFRYDGGGRSENWQPTAALMQFAGRRLPVAEYDDTEQRSISVKLTMFKNSDDREALERLIRSKNTLCYRDGRGRKMFCHALQLPIDDEVYGNTVSLTFEEVSYTEEV
jgi:hypothetical protein